MTFPWLDRTPHPDGGAERRTEVACAELATRAATLFRLGFTEAAASARLAQRVAWEHDEHGGARPEALSDAAIAKIVAETYARRPG